MRTVVYVIVPNWNGKDLLGPCLDSLQRQTRKATVVVVDNGSRDGSVDFVKKHYPAVRVVSLDNNRGFAGGVNAGIRFALERGANFVALFNNDAVADKNWLKNLVSVLDRNPKVGIATPKLKHLHHNTFDSTGDFYTVYGLSFPRGRNQEDNGQYDKPELVFAASGGASLYRATMLRQIGLFDERFFAYFEDVDISFRAQLAGWLVRYEPSSVAYHTINATASKLGDFSRYHSLKNFLMLYVKNMPGWLFWKYLPLFAYQFGRSTVSNLLHGKAVLYLKAVGVFLWYLPGLLVDRYRIQRYRRLTTKQVDELLYHGRPPEIPPLPKR